MADGVNDLSALGDGSITPRTVDPENLTTDPPTDPVMLGGTSSGVGLTFNKEDIADTHGTIREVFTDLPIQDGLDCQGVVSYFEK